MNWSKLLAEVSFEFSRGSGPGGQHRNKTSSKAVLRWNISGTEAFSSEELSRLRRKLESIITKDGDILVASEDLREQAANKEACLRKLKALLQEALRMPKKRVPTKPSKAARRKRLDTKKKRGLLKAGRHKKAREF